MLDARQLDALAAVIEHGSFGAAAKALSLTLAAVSLRLKSLEAEVGQRLVVRGRQVSATPAGLALLGHVRQLRLMEADVLAGLGGGGDAAMQTLSVAVNADSLASWFLPGVAGTLQRHRLLLDVIVDDQDHTHDALKSGEVTGCVTTLAEALRGCVAEPLGIMRYRCVAAPSLIAQWREPAADGVSKGRRKPTAGSPHRLLQSPAVIFNRKDALQDAFLAQHLGLKSALYPRHFVPGVEGFEQALELGLGWGMVPDLLLAQRASRLPLTEVLEGRPVDVALYWQHWAREPLSAQRLTAAIKAAGRQRLLQA